MAHEIGTLYTTDGKVTEVHPQKGTKFSLKELQGFVEGYLEIVPGTAVKGNPAAYCNEEGLLKGMEVNANASGKFGFPLVGPVIQVRRLK